MIIPSDVDFPNNVVLVLADKLSTLDSDLFVAKRQLRPTDPVQSIGVYAQTWLPNNESLEMKGFIAGQEPTISRYTVGVQSFVKHMDEIIGLATHGTLSKMVRTMLYNDDGLAISLRNLSVAQGSVTERMMRWGISNQRFASNEISAQWLYLSTLEFWFETETV